MFLTFPLVTLIIFPYVPLLIMFMPSQHIQQIPEKMLRWLSISLIFFFQYFCVFSGNNSSVALSSQIIFLALQKCSKQCSLMRYVAILNQCGIFLSRFCYRQESFNQISGLHSIKILNCNI